MKAEEWMKPGHVQSKMKALHVSCTLSMLLAILLNQSIGFSCNLSSVNSVPAGNKTRSVSYHALLFRRYSKCCLAAFR